jgi:hypothetical protein
MKWKQQATQLDNIKAMFYFGNVRTKDFQNHKAKFQDMKYNPKRSKF